MSRRSSSRERILDAADAVVLELGAAHMTMDAVAARARVSKGGLIYHFPSIRELLMAMLDRFTNLVEGRIREVEITLPAGPARKLKAHILGLCAPFEERPQTPQALLAASAREPRLLEAAQVKRRAVMDEVIHSTGDPVRASILILATEGMWISQLLGVSSFTPLERKRLREAVLRQADEWFGSGGGARGRRRRAPARRKEKGRA